jgi:hypothetical protein
MTDHETDVFIYDVTTPDGEAARFVSLLPPDLANVIGLPGEAVMGKMGEGEEVGPDNFETNPEFLRFLHWVIGKHGSDCPGIIEACRRQQDGFVYVLDARTPDPTGEVSSEDIIGAVKVENGEPISYEGHSAYRVFTENGFLGLEPWLKEKLIEEIRALPSAGGEARA